MSTSKLSASDYELLLQVADSLQGARDAATIVRRVMPSLQQLTGADQIAFGVSRSGARHDHDWFSTTLRALFEDAAVVELNFIKTALIAAPNRVLRE